jgi:hypothetical protein
MTTKETMIRNAGYTKNDDNCGTCDWKVKGLCTLPSKESEAFKTPNRASCSFHYQAHP